LVVLDSSAILAVILNEPGADLVAESLGTAIVGTVNAAETYTIATRKGLAVELVRGFLDYPGIEIVPLTLLEAEAAGRMIALTAKSGLSLGDRCCLALGLSRQVRVMTADRAWLPFAEPLGLTIEVIR
jgi:ribonuclease VapC